MASSETTPLRVYFFPFLAHGHLIPMLDMAKLFAANGVESTIITTPVNSIHTSKLVSKSNLDIRIETIPFPSLKVGLPQGCENIDMLPSPDLFFNFFQAANLLQEPLEELLESETPDCLICDLFFPWSVDSAKKFNVPRLVFHGTSFFAMCAMDILRRKKPYKSVNSDGELFCLPDLPDKIWTSRTEFPIGAWEEPDNGLGKILTDAEEANEKSYGMVVNSFFELEPGYADFYRNVMNKKAWCVGPVSTCNRNVEEKGMRGKESAIEDNQCLKWLDDKRPDSVVYVCFGSGVSFPGSQLHEIALGLELSGHNFIWVIRRGSNSESNDYLPEGFEDRVKNRGLLIQGWAPQVLILDHPSVGGFVTHCGWNSALEGITAGQPLVTWPLYAEQFFNEKLITNVLKIGVGVGAKKWSRNGEDHIDNGKIEKAVRNIMDGEEAEERRHRARQFGKMAKSATEKEGSSYIDLHNLLDELKAIRESSNT